MRIDVELGSEAQRKLEQRLSAGLSASDIVLAGLTQLEENEAYESYLRDEIALGIAALDAGKVSNKTVEQIGDEALVRFRSQQEG